MNPVCTKYPHMATCSEQDFLYSIKISFNSRDYQSFYIVNGVGIKLLNSIELLATNSQRKFEIIDARNISTKSHLIDQLALCDPNTIIVINHISEFDEGHNPDSLMRLVNGLFTNIGYQENLVMVPEILDKLYKTGCTLIGVDYENTLKVIQTGKNCNRMYVCEG